MSVLLWWLIPVVVTALAVGMLAIRDRRQKNGPSKSKQEAQLRRMGAALKAPLPSPPPKASRPEDLPDDVIDLRDRAQASEG